MNTTPEQLNNSDWRKNWLLDGNRLTHASGIQFLVEEIDGKVNVRTIPEQFKEFMAKQIAQGKTPEDISNLVNEIAPQVQAFYYESMTGRKTSFASVQ